MESPTNYPREAGEPPMVEGTAAGVGAAARHQRTPLPYS